MLLNVVGRFVPILQQLNQNLCWPGRLLTQHTLLKTCITTYIGLSVLCIKITKMDDKTQENMQTELTSDKAVLD